MAFFFEVFPSARDLVQQKCLDCSDTTYFSSPPDHAHNSSPPAHYLVHTLGCASGCYHCSTVAHHSFTYKHVFTPTLQCLVGEAQTMLPYPICKQYLFLLSSMETWWLPILGHFSMLACMHPNTLLASILASNYSPPLQKQLGKPPKLRSVPPAQDLPKVTSQPGIVSLWNCSWHLLSRFP